MVREIENAVLQSDTNQVGYDWLDIKTLNTLPLYPSKLRRQIINLYEGKEHKVYHHSLNTVQAAIADK